MNGRNKPRYPRGERVWVGYYDKGHDLMFILTSKESSREFFFLYELVDGSFKKLGRARSPKELEAKFDVEKKLGWYGDRFRL